MRTAQVLQIDYPSAVVSEADMRKRVRLLIEQLSNIGFNNTGDYRYAVQMVFRYQQEAQWRGPMPEVIIDKLRSVHVTTEKKIEALEQLFIFGGEPDLAIEGIGLREQ